MQFDSRPRRINSEMMCWLTLRWGLAGSLLLAAGCSSAFAVAPQQDGGVGDATTGPDAGTSGPTPDAGNPADGGADAASAADGSGGEAGLAIPCAVGTTQPCTVPTTNAAGVTTCVQAVDGGGPAYRGCVATACDSTAKLLANEACIPAGSFIMGGLDGGADTGAAEPDTLPGHRVILARRFYFDLFEVTVGELEAWWGGARSLPAEGTILYTSGSGEVVRWSTPDGGVAAVGTLIADWCTDGTGVMAASISCVPYATALAYCASLGKRLPTEAEWEYVATSGGANNYPWGSTPPDDSCTHAIDLPCHETLTAWPFPRPAAVPGDTPSADGNVNNLAGNEAEWMLDFYPPLDCEGNCWPAGSVDPLGAVDNGNGHVVRGGSFESPAFDVRTRARAQQPAENSVLWGTVGFRCARDEL